VLSAGLAVVAELDVVELPLELAAVVDAAFRARESKDSMSSCAEVRSPFCRSVPSWLSSSTKEVELPDEDAMSDRRLVVIPLERQRTTPTIERSDAKRRSGRIPVVRRLRLAD
jgi:hypothetical protein